MNTKSRLQRVLALHLHFEYRYHQNPTPQPNPANPNHPHVPFSCHFLPRMPWKPLGARLLLNSMAATAGGAWITCADCSSGIMYSPAEKPRSATPPGTFLPRTPTNLPRKLTGIFLPRMPKKPFSCGDNEIEQLRVGYTVCAKRLQS